MKTADELKARALTLKDFVDYNAGAVVSKTLIDKKVGTLTLFAFDAGQGLSEHTAPFDAVVQVLDGEAELIIAGSVVNTKAGELVIMPAGVPHAVRARQRFKMLLTMIREQ
ncbi:MAG: cupin domain-containing protein [Lentisphaerae bacterium]|nr:cupin domain-containing protein [Lentisphaerota bacterium]